MEDNKFIKKFKDCLKSENALIEKVNAKTNTFEKISFSDAKSVERYLKSINDFRQDCLAASDELKYSERLHEADEIVRCNTPISLKENTAQEQIASLKKAIKIYEELQRDDKAKEVSATIKTAQNKILKNKADNIVKQYSGGTDYHSLGKLKEALTIYNQLGEKSLASHVSGIIARAETKNIKKKRKYQRRQKAKDNAQAFFGWFGSILGLVVLPLGLCAFSGYVIFAHRIQIQLIIGKVGIGWPIFGWVAFTLITLVFVGRNIYRLYDDDLDKWMIAPLIVSIVVSCGAGGFLTYKTISELEPNYSPISKFVGEFESLDRDTDKTTVNFTIANHSGYNFKSIKGELICYNELEIVEKIDYTVNSIYSQSDDFTQEYIKEAEESGVDIYSYPQPCTATFTSSKLKTLYDDDIGIIFSVSYINFDYWKGDLNPHSQIIIKDNGAFQNREELYKNAKNLMSKKDYIEAHKIFNSLYDYKDCMDLAKKCLSHISSNANALYNNSNFIDAYDLYIYLESVKYEASNTSYDCIENQGKAAYYLAKAGDREGAYALITPLTERGVNTSTMIKYVDYYYAQYLLNQNQYEEAKAEFAKLGNFENSVNYYKYECDYEKAVDLYNAGKFDEATPIFKALAESNYSNSKDFLERCYCQEGVAYYNQGKYAEAFEIFYKYKSNSYANDYINKIDSFVKAKVIELAEKGQYKEAYDYLNAMGTSFKINTSYLSYFTDAYVKNNYTKVISNLGIKKLVVPEGVTEIAENGVYSVKLESVSLPSTLTKIGNYSFAYSTVGNSLVIPEGVTEIGYYSFAYMKNLFDITLPKSLKTFGSGMLYAYKTDRTLQKVIYNGTKEEFLAKTSLTASWLDGYKDTDSTLKIQCSDYTYYFLTKEWTAN